MLGTLLNGLALSSIAYVAICAGLFLFQRSLIYYPQPRSPAADATTFTMSAEDGPVVVTTRGRKGSDAVVYFGGNAEDVSYSLPGLSEAFPEHAIFLLHYRGYGGSSGKPTEAALISDALALFDRIHGEHPNIVVIGRSLGSGVAVRVASLRPVTRLVLVTPYDSLEKLAARQFPYVPVRWLLQDKFESWRYASRISAPTLLIAAEHDEIIPGESTQSLLSRFRSGVATFRSIRGANHNTVSESPEYIPLLRGVP